MCKRGRFLSSAVAFVLAAVLLASCKRARNWEADEEKEQPAMPAPPSAEIRADPNPVPFGKGRGKTKIVWKTPDGKDAQVYVCCNSKPETLLARGPSGSVEVDWIQTQFVYDFTLYAGTEHLTRLASVRVTRPVPAILEAKPNPVPAGDSPGKTMIVWNTGDGTAGQVYVSHNGKPEALVVTGRTGSQELSWIAGGTYVFRLYAGQDHKRVLASVQVKRTRMNAKSKTAASEKTK